MLRFEDVALGYGGTCVLRDLDLAIGAGELVGVLGANGSGKTTLVRGATRLIAPSAGRVLLAGRSITAYDRRELARTVAVVPQEGTPIFPFTVLETVLMGRAPWLRPFAFEGRGDLEIAQDALAAVGALELAQRDLSELSGGERQRVVVARALAQCTGLLLADEPTAHLDLRHAVAIFALMRRLVDERGLAAMLVTHDVNLAAMYCHRLAVLAGGRVLAVGAAAEVVTREVLSEAFGTPLEVERRGDGTLYVVPAAASGL